MSMLRVSSRQRLVSWDAFDASFVSSAWEGESFFSVPTEEDGATQIFGDVPLYESRPNEDCEEAVVVLKRKRMIHEIDGSLRTSASSSSLRVSPSSVVYDCPPTTIPTGDSTTTKEEEDEECLQLIDLPTEVQLHLFQFLELSDLRSLSHVCHSERTLLQQNDAASAVWKPLCMQLWPYLEEDFTPRVCTMMKDRDNQLMDYALLLSMAALNVPRAIDTSLFSPYYHTRLRSRARSLRSLNPTGILSVTNPSSSLLAPKLVLVDVPTATSSPISPGKAVQFVGPVGLGDRCIRADAPLPRPLRLERRKKLSPSLKNVLPLRGVLANHVRPGGLMQRWRLGAATAAVTPSLRSSLLCPLRRSVQDMQFQNASVYRPFCAPFVSRQDGTIQMTPRYIAYFEVSILPRRTEATVERPAVFAPLGAVTPATDCVAVGLAIDGFALHNRMPGWDLDSYGYHGDDGGIFHGAGSMIQEYGAHFGVGDTIGCGIDYIRQAIFYTRNGAFLGYALELSPQHIDVDLYPVIGMDSQYPVWCNFGTEEPFLYNLEELMEPQEPIVRHHLWF